jgi:hypothetical protein
LVVVAKHYSRGEAAHGITHGVVKFHT